MNGDDVDIFMSKIFSGTQSITLCIDFYDKHSCCSTRFPIAFKLYGYTCSSKTPHFIENCAASAYRKVEARGKIG